MHITTSIWSQALNKYSKVLCRGATAVNALQSQVRRGKRQSLVHFHVCLKVHYVLHRKTLQLCSEHCHLRRRLIVISTEMCESWCCCVDDTKEQKVSPGSAKGDNDVS